MDEKMLINNVKYLVNKYLYERNEWYDSRPGTPCPGS